MNGDYDSNSSGDENMTETADIEDTAAAPVRPRVLAIASGGGHWHELLRLRPALEGCDVHFAGIDRDWASSVAPHPFHFVPDAHFDEPFKMLRTFFALWSLSRRLRPDAVVSTGAAPGGLAMLAGRRFGARTMWIDSAANCARLSRSGRLARRFAHVTLTQWPELALPGGPFYRGSILR